MKRKRNLIIMAAVLVVLCCVILAEQKITQHYDSINSTDEVIVAIEQDNLTAVTWTYEEVTLSFANTDGTWVDADDADFPVNQETLAEFLANFEEVHACFIIDDVEDYSQYGLDDPECIVTISTADGDVEISMGTYSTMDAQRYVSIDDGKVYLIEDDLLEYISTERDDFMQQDEVPEIVELVAMTVSGDNTLSVVYDTEGSYCYTDSYNYYNVVSAGYYALDDSSVESYLSTLANLSLTDYVTYTASAEDMSEYGLDNPAYTITVTGQVEVETDDEAETEEATYVIYIGTIVTAAESEDEEDTTTAYARIGDSEIVYQLTTSQYTSIAANGYDDLRPTAVLALDWELVTAVSFTIDGSTYVVDSLTWEAYTELVEVSEDDEELDMVYMIDGTTIDFDDVVDAVDDMTINTFNDESATKTKELSMTVTLDNASYPTVSVDIYQYDGDNCLVIVDGTTVGLMSRSDMVDLKEAVTSIILSLE